MLFNIIKTKIMVFSRSGSFRKNDKGQQIEVFSRYKSLDLFFSTLAKQTLAT